MSLLTKVSQAAPARPLCPCLEELQGTEQRSCSPLSAVSRELKTSLLLPSVRLQGSDKTARSSCPPGGRQVSWLWSLPGYRHVSPSPLPSGKAMPGKPIFLPAQIIRQPQADLLSSCSALTLTCRNVTCCAQSCPLRLGLPHSKSQVGLCGLYTPWSMLCSPNSGGK